MYRSYNGHRSKVHTYHPCTHAPSQARKCRCTKTHTFTPACAHSYQWVVPSGIWPCVCFHVPLRVVGGHACGCESFCRKAAGKGQKAHWAWLLSREATNQPQSRDIGITPGTLLCPVIASVVFGFCGVVGSKFGKHRRITKVHASVCEERKKKKNNPRIMALILDALSLLGRK